MNETLPPRLSFYFLFRLCLLLIGWRNRRLMVMNKTGHAKEEKGPYYYYYYFFFLGGLIWKRRLPPLAVPIGISYHILNSSMSNPFLFRKKNLRPSPLNSNEFKHSFRSLSQFLVEIIITLRYGQLETCRNVIYVLLLYLYRETKQTEKRISISRVSSSPLLLLLLLLSPYTNILVVILFSCRRFHLRFISFFFSGSWKIMPIWGEMARHSKL